MRSLAIGVYQLQVDAQDRNVAMPHQARQGVQVHAIPQGVDRERAPERVHRKPNARRLSQPEYDLLEPVVHQWPTAPIIAAASLCASSDISCNILKNVVPAGDNRLNCPGRGSSVNPNR